MFKDSFLSIMVVLLLLIPTVTLAEWVIETVAIGGSTLSISLDSFDHPRIVHSHADAAEYLEYNGTNWVTTFLYVPVVGGCGWFDIFTDEFNMSHVSFSANGVPVYAVEDSISESWSITLLSPPYCYATSLTLDEDVSPAISIYSTDENLQLISFDGANWITTIVDSSINSGEYHSMVIDSENFNHIAYSHNSTTAGLKYAVCDQSRNWDISFIDTTIVSEPKGISLALDTNDWPRVSYTTPSELRYAEWNGSLWTIEVIDAVDSGAGLFGTSLALDQYGYPHIAHCRADSLLYSKNTGDGWETERVFYPLNYLSGDPDLVLDSENKPHIAFTRVYPWNLMYAHDNGASSVHSSECVLETSQLSVSPNPFEDHLSISFNISAICDIKLAVYDLQGRIISELLSGTHSEGNYSSVWIPDVSLPQGEYIVVLDTPGRAFSEKVFWLK